MTNPTRDAIRANILLMEQRLMRALALAVEGRNAICRGEQNIAVGTLVPLQADIADADALLKTVFVLHRSRPDASEGGAQ